MEIRELGGGDRDRAVELLGQLWTDTDSDTIRSWCDESDYRLFGAARDGDLVGVAGVYVQHSFHHARHVWVHDLVVDEPHRSTGVGSALLEFLEEWGAERDCEYLALALRAGNERAREFYRENGMTEWGSVIETEL